ncbi:UDP-N-acetylglucosamine 1-carboxyvinyltransferase, partial [Patescibacteria group bacterium]|nr:UDP-N-acetylglucosamine 1-carboxyvinyltransferase [Patescibacteria group bacterium]
MRNPVFVIEGLDGEKTLSGIIPVYGAKNAVLPALAAALLVPGESTFENVPGIADIPAMGRILEGLGAHVHRDGRTLTVNAKEITNSVLDSASAKALRASVLFIGSVLARTGRVTFPPPGGDVLNVGERPIDLFISAFQSLGATFSQTEDTYTLAAPNGLSGGEFFFRVVTVTGTEAVMMAATLAKAPVTLKNCALEPEVVATAEYLKSCGARIEGAGTSTIVIYPSVLSAPAKPTRIIPDRIESASFLALGALAAKELTVTGLEPAHLDAVIQGLQYMGVPLTIGKDFITVRAPEKLLPTRLRTHEYPGFATDAHPPLLILLTQAEGDSVMIESIFDGRLAYTKELVKMGADIT